MYERSGRTVAGGTFATAASRASAPAERTPAELAREHLVQLERDVDAARGALQAVQTAKQANQPEQWQIAKARLDARLATATQSRDRSLKHEPAATRQRDEAIASLADLEDAVATVCGEPPSGITPVPRESEIEAILAAPIDGTARSAFAAKERELVNELAGLSAADAQILMRRLRTPRTNDTLAALFGRLTSERRERILSFLAGARRREALRPRGPTPLPDPVRSDLERATGSSLSAVRVHADDHGDEIARSHGARGVAIGEDIYLAEGHLDPETRSGRALIAHETAHVLQARPSGDGKRRSASTEAAELEADGFATEFASGGPSIPFAPSVSVASGTPMRTGFGDVHEAERRMEAGLPPLQLRTLLDAGEYLTNYKTPHVQRAITDFLLTRPLDPGDPQLRFTSGPVTFVLALLQPFETAPYVPLGSWMAPFDLVGLVNRTRPIFEREDKTNVLLGPATWAPEVGTAIASTFAGLLGESLRRLGPRLVAVTAAARAEHRAVRRSDLVVSTPLDAEVSRAILGSATPTIEAIASIDTSRDVTSRAVTTLRPLRRVDWQGAHRRAWNAVRVEPADATVEEVAAHLLGASTEAYQLRHVGEDFIVPDELAAKFPDAAKYRSVSAVSAKTQIAFGPEANAAIAAEAKRVSPSNVTVGNLWVRIDEQLRAIQSIVGPLGFGPALTGSLRLHQQRKADAASHESELANQYTLLSEISGDLAQLIAVLGNQLPKAGTPAFQAMWELVDAAVHAHLAETGRAMLVQARAGRRAQILDTLQAGLGDARSHIEAASRTEGQAAGDAEVSRRALGATHDQRAVGLGRELAELRDSQPMDPKKVASISQRIGDLQLDAQLVADIGALGQIFHSVHELKDDKWTMAAEFIEANGQIPLERLKLLETGSNKLRTQLQIIHSRVVAVQKKVADLTAAYVSAGVSDAETAARAYAAGELAVIRRDLQALGGDEHVQAFIKAAASMLDDIALRTQILKIATLIGVMVVSMGAGAVAEGAVAGAIGPGLGAQLAGMAIDTTTFTLLNAKLSGEPLLHAFLSNFGGNFATFAAIRIAKQATAASWIGKTLENAKTPGEVGKIVFAATKLADLSITGLVTGGVQFAQAELESAIANGRTMSLDELQQAGAQGMAMMIGAALLHQGFGSELDNIKGAVAGKVGARKTSRQLTKLATDVYTAGNPQQAIELLNDARVHFEAEAARWTELSALGDRELVARGSSRAMVDAMGKNARAGLDALGQIENPIVVAQISLDTVMPGQVYAGDHATVKGVLDRCDQRGWTHSPVADGYTVSGDGTTIHIIERAEDAAAPGSHPGHADVDAKTKDKPRSSQAGSSPTVDPTLGHLGAQIASRVPGVTYKDGRFHVATAHGDVVVEVRRTSGALRFVHANEHAAMLEVPTGLGEAELATTIAGKLVEAHGDPIDKPKRTPYGDVWPGEVPDFIPEKVRPVFEEAAKQYHALSGDNFQGAQAGRIHWAKYLVDHGIPIEGIRYSTAPHEVYEISKPAPRGVAAHDAGVAQTQDIGTRSPNTGHVTIDACLRAVDEIFAHGAELHHATRAGHVVTIPLADHRMWTIRIAEPRPTGDHMAALKHEGDVDVVWVSDRLIDEHVPRALGAIIGESIDGATRSRSGGAAFGEIDAMFSHRDAVTAALPLPNLHDDATPAQIKAHATAASRQESTERIDAEIDLALARLSLSDPADPRLATLPEVLADRIRGRLKAAVVFHGSAALSNAQVAQPKASSKTTLPASSVLPDAPTQVHAYSAADRGHVIELRTELAAIKEIDARVANRDRPGTNGGREIAEGEMTRRAGHVARARELLADLQLGGTDTTYIEARLKELSNVFPSVERDIVPAVRDRVQRRNKSEGIRHHAEIFRAEQLARSQALATEILAATATGAPFITKRAVVGAGMSGLADVATLRPSKTGSWIDPHDILVIGNDDVIARIDPQLRWGQRAAVYDRPDDAHPAFSDPSGRGDGSLDAAVEDPGNFMRVGELRDAADLSRERLGIAPLRAVVKSVETTKDRAKGSPDWDPRGAGANVRLRVEIAGREVYIYAEDTDLAVGIGKPRMPHSGVLTPRQRAALSTADDDGERILVGGDELLAGKAVRGKRVLVLAFGPTGAWASVRSVERGAARVDWTGANGGEQGTGKPVSKHLDDGKRRRREGPEDDPEVPSNDLEMERTGGLDRVQDALDPNSGVHATYDRVISIERKGDGGVVTFAHGPAESVELYKVEYDLIVGAMGFSQSTNDPTVRGEPTVREMIGNMKMTPHRESDAPITEDANTGHVRIIGFAAGDATNLVLDKNDEGQKLEKQRFKARREKTMRQTSADSPDDRVVEGAGKSTRDANKGRESP